MNNNYISYCTHCEQQIVVCGLCGMNTCSGGYGEINGEPCPQCPTAYLYYENLYKNENT